MAKKIAAKSTAASPRLKSSVLVDTRVVYCGDNLEQLKKLSDACVDLIYIDPPFNSNRNYEIFWGETKEKRAFEDRHENTRAYIDFFREEHRIIPLIVREILDEEIVRKLA
jgi:DNA modification methylase